MKPAITPRTLAPDVSLIPTRRRVLSGNEVPRFEFGKDSARYTRTFTIYGIPVPDPSTENKIQLFAQRLERGLSHS